MTRKSRRFKADWRGFGKKKALLLSRSQSWNPLRNASLRAYRASKTVESLEAEKECLEKRLRALESESAALSAELESRRRDLERFRDLLRRLVGC